ncbi:acyl carrier protein [uncultured Roseobacter sp.]|uniref:acyl carrier protein n=1 Tax=uncultured Roseobacter sp. TaxID=114847 RepID=UPI00261F70D3|nr:acyl carrier protein [uncultured Roseobacter sp.]
MIERAALVDFLEGDLGVDMSDIDDSSALFSSGIVDSFALVTLMMHMERLGGFRINPGDVTLDNFDSIERILAFCERANA